MDLDKNEILLKMKEESDYQKGYLAGVWDTLKRTATVCLALGGFLYWFSQQLGILAWDYPPVRAAYYAFSKAARGGGQ